MGMTTMGVKLDDATRERIKTAATRIDRTPHWLIKQAIFNYLERLESEEGLPELPALLAGAVNEGEEAATAADENHQPFLEFAEQILPQSVSRHYRRLSPCRNRRRADAAGAGAPAGSRCRSGAQPGVSARRQAA